MLDLHEGVLEIFEERQGAATDRDFQSLRLDNYTARDVRYEVAWLEEARIAPGCVSFRCAHCGGEVVTKPGSARLFHMGGGCPADPG
jgi:hypothetical protein